MDPIPMFMNHLMDLVYIGTPVMVIILALRAAFSVRPLLDLWFAPAAETEHQELTAPPAKRFRGSRYASKGQARYPDGNPWGHIKV